MKQMEIIEYVVPRRTKLENYSKSFIRNMLFGVCAIVFVVIIAVLSFIAFTLQQKLANSSDILLGLTKNMSELSMKELQWSKIVSDLSRNISGLSQNVSGTLQNLSNNMPEPSMKELKKLNSFNSSLYVFGGEDNNQIFLSSASHFNSSTGEWTSINTMPDDATQMCGAVVGSNIYLFGGLKGGRSNRNNLNTATVYESSTGVYTFLQPMPESRESCGAAVLNGYIYVAGGTVGNSHDYSSSVNRFKILNNQWSTVSSMKTARRGLELVELGGRLYAIGGKGTKTVEVYDPPSDSWSYVASTQYEHYWFGATVHESKIYVIDWHGFEVYSPQSDRWETLTMPSKHDRYTLISMNGKLWTVGGSYKDDNKDKAIKTVFTYDNSSRQWDKQRDMDVGRMFHTAFVVNH